MDIQLIIFDMDGTLVQSEDCASQALLDVIPALEGSAADITARYRGVNLADILSDIENSMPGSVPDGCIELYRERENFLSTTMISPSQGVAQMLSQLHTDKCIASNAPVKKTKRSLELCGLSRFFENAIFSAYDVQAWKPDPTLFLHAASVYNVRAENCLVVEDSIPGIQAAQAARMVPIFYNPHELTKPSEGVKTITAFTELLSMLKQ